MAKWLFIPLLLAAGCVAPPGPMERLSNSAYGLNNATRFGRLDVALGHVASEEQGDFMHRHSKWGRDVRIVDLELQGLRLITPDTAEVQLTVSWHRLDETTMRTSNLAQKWTQGKSGWELVEELRASGSPGLFARPDGKKAKTLPAVEGVTTTDWE
jgi:hypothetical protein